MKRKCLSFKAYKMNVEVSTDSETNLCCNTRTLSVMGQEQFWDAERATKIK